ncbi:hypothetical protein OAR42_04525 [Planktomarina temperata]|nr:hypothetical protein [Planktomarina temperata]MDC6462627.1 hypothetical protein [Planktomarina temperata]
MNIFRKALFTITFVLFGSTVGAEQLDASTKLWNKLDPLIEQCNASMDENIIKNIALELWSISKLPFGLRMGAEACVNKFVKEKAILTWESGWQFLIDDDEKKVWSRPIRELIETERASCIKSEGGDFQVPVTAIESVDLTGNGSKDTVVYEGRFRCNGSSSYYSGSGGSTIHLIVADQVFSYFARGFEVVFPFSNANPVLIFAVHGSFCDSYGANSCVLATIWGDGGFQFVKAE